VFKNQQKDMLVTATLSLGAKIRQFRKDKKWNLVRLAERCHISPSFLSQIERDQANPSVTTLYAIAETLGISMATLFSDDSKESDTEPVSPQESAQVVRAGYRKAFLYPGVGIRNEFLSPDLNRALQMMWIVMPPEADSGETPFMHQGEECGIILQGQIETWVGGQRFVLNPGDAIYHDSMLPHRTRNIGTTDVIMVVAKTPPSL
jgi:transcriptional regulator with XRE-family HTH domain